VVALVGGVEENRSLGGRGGESFHHVSKERQQQAVRFLLDHAFSTPHKLLQPGLVNRFKYFAVADDVMSQQTSLLENLLSGRRFHQLMDAEALGPDQAYTAMQFLTEVQDGIWSELKAPQACVDVCRRHLQRAYLDYFKRELNLKETPALRPVVPGDGDTVRLFSASTRETDFRAVARAALQDLDKQLLAAIPQTPDAMTKVHLQNCRHEIDLILNPKS
jgi:hypothetical protein